MSTTPTEAADTLDAPDTDRARRIRVALIERLCIGLATTPDLLLHIAEVVGYPPLVMNEFRAHLDAIGAEQAEGRWKLSEGPPVGWGWRTINRGTVALYRYGNGPGDYSGYAEPNGDWVVLHGERMIPDTATPPTLSAAMAAALHAARVEGLFGAVANAPSLCAWPECGHRETLHVGGPERRWCRECECGEFKAAPSPEAEGGWPGVPAPAFDGPTVTMDAVVLARLGFFGWLRGKGFDVAQVMVPTGAALEPRYYLLSLSRSKGQPLLVWWRPDAKGYTGDLDEAGRYTDREIERYRSMTAVPVPCEAVDEMTRPRRVYASSL